MRIKLDLHPIFSEGRQIETALQQAIDDACDKRASEIEIIPGKGSGALKKSVLRFLDRPEIKARYHRVEKDSDNWGRLFVHFRWTNNQSQTPQTKPTETTLTCSCFCCAALMNVPYDEGVLKESLFLASKFECLACGSPNNVNMRVNRKGDVATRSESGYTN